MRPSKTIQAEIEGLTEQQAELEKKAAALRLERDAMDAKDARRAVSRLGVIANELTGIEQLLPSLRKQIESLTAERNEAREAEEQAALTAIRPRERAAAERIVDLTAQLKAALDELGTIRREIAELHGWSLAQIPDALGIAVATVTVFWDSFSWWHGEGGSMNQPIETLPNPNAKERPDPDKKVKQEQIDRAAAERERRRAGGDPDRTEAAWAKVLSSLGKK